MVAYLSLSLSACVIRNSNPGSDHRLKTELVVYLENLVEQVPPASDIQKLMVETKSSQLIMNDHNLDSNYYKQNQLSEEMKYSLIKLSTLYWFNLFECIKVVNRYCRTIFNLGVNSMT
jgi:hypothetical protein